MSRTAVRTLLALAALLVWGCDDSGSDPSLDDAAADGDTDVPVSGELSVPAECGTPFPAFGCDGNPIGTWELVGLCFETYGDCAGASVHITGALQGALTIGGDTSFSHEYDLDYEQQISVPQRCLDGASCDGIGCFGTDHCSCTNGTASGGSQSGSWSMLEPGRVTIDRDDGPMEFCAGDEYGDSTGGGIRRVWRRTSPACTEGSACDDGLACTQDYCAGDTGGCAHIAVPTGGPEGWLGEPVCENGLDDDCDGLADLDDPDCLSEPCTADAECTDDGNPCTLTTCGGDGFCHTVDAPDGTPCPGSDACSPSYLCRGDACVPGPATLDADADGFVDAACPLGADCDDGAAELHPGAEGPRGAASCTDAVDNDCDGIVDVYDADCWETACSPEGWCLEHPRPLADDLRGLWAPAPDDVWAVGGDGHIIHWDGTGWSRAAKPGFFTLLSVCGCGADDGWAVDVAGDVFHYDGGAWSHVDVPGGQPSAYHAVGCVCDGLGVAQEVWAVGRDGAYTVFDGVTWSHGTHPTIATELTDVWVAAPGDAWVVSDGGVISHGVAGAWEDAASGESADLNAIWGASAQRIWAVGQAGTFSVYDGAGGWSSPSAFPDNPELYDVWGPGGDVIWVAGDEVLYDYDTVLDAWNAHELGLAPPTLRAVRGFGPQDMWAVGEGGAILHVDEEGPATSNYLTTVDLLGVCGSGSGDSQRVWAVGLTEAGFFVRDQGGWRMVPATLSDRMRDVYCAGDRGVFAVGGTGWARWGDGVFETGEVPDVDLADDLLAVDGRVGPAGVELFAVGDDGLLARYDGESWTVEYLFSSSATIALRDVWVSPDPQAAVQAVAVAEEGWYLVFDGTTWTPTDLDIFEDFNAVWGDGQGGIWAVGDQGLVRSWNGTTFEPLELGGEPEYLHDVTGTGPSDVWILGEDNVWSFDGSSWTSEPMELADPQKLYVTSTEVWAVGRNGAVLHRPR